MNCERCNTLDEAYIALNVELNQAKDDLKGTMQPGGYEYFSKARDDAERTAHNAIAIAEKLRQELAESKATIETLIRCHHDEPCTVVVIKQDAEIKRLMDERDSMQKNLDEAIRVAKANADGWARALDKLEKLHD